MTTSGINGPRLRHLREQRRYSRAALAGMVNTSRERLRLIEQGKYPHAVRIEEALRYAEALDVDVAEVVTV